jgi:putative ABC transport system ATP-binding protein
VIALDGVDLRIGRGEFTAIMGPSGSGKSTLLGILGCLDLPSSGEYRLEGLPVASLDDVSLSRLRNRRIGFVFQSFHLLPRLSVEDNVATPLAYGGVPEAEWRPRARRCLERVGISHRAEHLPAELSGGEAQRAAVARALVMEPSVLLADEPTGNLDSETGDEVADLLADLNAEGRTVVLVTHDERMARRARRLVRLRDGRVDADHGLP